MEIKVAGGYAMIFWKPFKGETGWKKTALAEAIQLVGKRAL